MRAMTVFAIGPLKLLISFKYQGEVPVWIYSCPDLFSVYSNTERWKFAQC